MEFTAPEAESGADAEAGAEAETEAEAILARGGEAAAISEVAVVS